MQNVFNQFDEPLPPPAMGGPQPQPWPGAVTGPSIPAPRIRAADQADDRIALDREANRRAEEANAREAERLRIAREAAERQGRTADMNAGVDTTASQDQAVGHAIMLQNHLTTLNDVVGKAGSEAVRPTWKEWGVAKVTSDDPTLVAGMQPEDRQRAATAYRGVLESAIWLYTGAAAPVEQVNNIRASLEPLVTDKPGTLEDKRRALLTIIAQAQARAGPANAKVTEALDFLKANTGLIYGDLRQDVEKPETKLTEGEGDTKSLPIPPAMQAEHDQFMKAAQPGKLSVDQYVGYYNDLTKRHGIEGNVDLKRAQEYVDAFNEGRPTVGTLPPPEVDQNAWEKISGGAAASELGTGVKNFASAMTMGVPELLAGQEGREASGIADEINPASALTGEVIGSLVPGIGLEKAGAAALKAMGAGAGSRTARVGGDMLGNAVYGGATEFNQTGDANTAAINALMGAGGVLPARGVAKGFAELKPETFRQGLKDLGPQDILDDAGNKVGTVGATDLTTAQRAGITGGEEFLSGLPGVSPMRQAAVADMNRHNSARVLAKVGRKLPSNITPGQDMNRYVASALSEEYTKIGPQVKGTIDNSFRNAVAGIRNSVLPPPRRGMKPDPKIVELWQPLENATAKFMAGKKFDFASYKTYVQDLREWQKYYGTASIGPEGIPAPTMNEMARQAEKLIKQARALVSRADPAAGARLKRIDEAYAHQMRIEMASRGAAKKERGVYAPEEYLSAIERLDTSKGKSATARGTAYEQPYGQSAMEVMGGKPAKGGSVLATGALGYTVGGAALSPALLAAYGPGIKRFTQALTDGRFGAKLDKLTPQVLAKEFPELPTDVVKQILVSYTREKTVGN